MSRDFIPDGKPTPGCDLCRGLGYECARCSGEMTAALGFIVVTVGVMVLAMFGAVFLVLDWLGWP